MTERLSGFVNGSRALCGAIRSWTAPPPKEITKLSITYAATRAAGRDGVSGVE